MKKTIVLIMVLMSLVAMTALANSGLWIAGKADFLPRKSPSQFLSLDIGFTIPTAIPGFTVDMYTGLLFVGDGPYSVSGKKLGGDFIYTKGGLFVKLGMYNCGIDRDHFYAEIRYNFFWPWSEGNNES